MMVFKIIDFRVSVMTILSVFIFALLFFDVNGAINLTLTGGVILGAFFMATDYAVVPRIRIAKYIYALLIGFITAIIWKYGNYHMAIYYAIIIVGFLSSVFNGLMQSYKHSKVR